MTGLSGRREPEDDTDQQCAHCGLWFSLHGINGHQPNCPLREYEETWINPVPGVPESGDASAPDPADEGGDPPAPESPPTPDAEGTAPDDPEPIRTDGAGLGLSGPPAPSTATDEEVEEEIEDAEADAQESEPCPECEREHDVGDLEPGRYRCDNCGATVRYTG